MPYQQAFNQRRALMATTDTLVRRGGCCLAPGKSGKLGLLGWRALQPVT